MSAFCPGHSGVPVIPSYPHSLALFPQACCLCRVICLAGQAGHCATAALGINSPLGSIGKFTFLDSCVRLTIPQAGITC